MAKEIQPIKISGKAVDTSSRYKKTYSSFAGTDIIAVLTPQDGYGKSIVLGELQTISYSTYRPTSPVYGLGRTSAKGVVRGARTIAGTLIFTVFDRHVLHEANKGLMSSDYADGSISNNTGLKADNFPAFDITINFMNEYGEAAQTIIYGVHLISEGQTMSIEDMITEATMEFVAMDIDSMVPDQYEDY